LAVDPPPQERAHHDERATLVSVPRTRTDEISKEEASRPVLPADRITVTLVPKAAGDLLSTHGRTRLSKTDIVNRAISLYEFIDTELTEGAELIIRRDGMDHIVKLL
jgi:hypothetical protein